jgi:hypothetical protein
LVLSPNWKLLDREADVERNELQRGTLPALTTERGISIGDKPPAVREKLGFPTHVQGTGGGNKTYTYVWRRGSKESGTEYRAVYTFRADRLQSIQFYEDSLGEG